MRKIRSLVLLLPLVALSGCDPEKQAKDLASAASSGANKLKEDAKSAAADQVDGMASAALSEVDKNVLAVKAKVFGLPDTGALSEGGTEWLSKQKPSTPGGETVEASVAKGKQIAPVVVEAHAVMNRAVDEDTAIEPIYQPIEAGKEPELDASIKAMPRLEVIDGVTVGFRKLDAIETTKVHKEQAVLVLWRREGHLVGFLYRTHRTIDVAVVVKETPRLYKLMNEAAS